jgi:hypothetical protein
MRPIINRKFQSTIQSVGNEEIGILYLERRNSISVGERMIIDEYQGKKNKAQILATQLIRKIAKDRSISFDEAQQLISSRNENGVSVDNSDIILEYAEDFTDLRFLTDSEAISMEVAVATIFIQNRVAYPLTLKKEASINSNYLEIHPISICLKGKNQIKFGHVSAIIRGNQPADIDVIQIEPLEQNIDANTTGFLMEGRKYALGSEEWTIEDTKALDENLVNEIFQFYENELLGWADPEPFTATTESEIEDAVGERLLTGTDSTGESKSTESAILDLPVGIAS